MKSVPFLLMVGLAIASLIQPLAAQAAEIVRPGPPIIILPPPRIAVQVPDVGPMQTREMAVSAKIHGLHATVETNLVFHNPNARELEGELIFPLPDGAAVCGYALDIGGVMVDGVVVTKERARVAFETETRRNVDPGLVEHVQGNLYRTRIYPLPANGERRIRLTYTTPLATAPNGDAALLLPMPREPMAKRNITIEVTTPGATVPELGGLGDALFTQAEQIWRVESSSENITPGEDVLVSLPKLPAATHHIERDAGGDIWFMLTDMPATAENASAPAIERIHILWDASGSRANADLASDLALLAKLEAPSFRLTIFRDLPEAPQDFDTLDALIAAIRRAPNDGGTDLHALASFLSENPATTNTRTLLFTDGFDTLSGQALDFAGISPIAIVSNPIADRESLRQACAGSLIDLLTTDAATAWAEIKNPSSRVTGLQGTGIAQVQGIGRPAAGRVTLLGQLTAPESEVRITYADGTTSPPFTLRAADAREATVLATAWASARVNQLAPRADDFEEELLSLGRAHGLVSPATSLIVLESLDQWVRHEIEPPATLPGMRRQWRDAMKNRPKTDTPDDSARLDHVVALWKQRVEWWKSDFSKAKARPVPDESDAEPPELPNSVGGGFPLTPATPAPETDGDGFSALDRFAEAPMPRSQASGRGSGGSGGSDPFAGGESHGEPANSTIEIKPWSPDTPYLKAIRSAKPAARYTAYLAERENWAQSPAFFLDCAEVFYQEKDAALARRILSNLAELRIEDAPMLRVFASRLRQAEDLDLATTVFRHLAKLRPEEPQSFRDLALVLADRGRANRSKADLEEAMQLLLRVALGTWERHGDTLTVFALEELNALVAWTGRQDWPADGKPTVPDYDKRLGENLHTDIRIVLTWDADATDIDLHVAEPGGEEAYYGHNRTARGGLVSEDIVDGYGPEEYLIRIAPTGKYTLFTNYFGSNQQTVIGPATITATIFTQWGRPGEQRQTLTLRLDKPKDKVELGAITFGRADLPTEASNLTPGLSRDQVIAILGKPVDPQANPLEYPAGPKSLRIHFNPKTDTLLRVTEALPGGIETLIVQ